MPFKRNRGQKIEAVCQKKISSAKKAMGSGKDKLMAQQVQETVHKV